MTVGHNACCSVLEPLQNVFIVRINAERTWLLLYIIIHLFTVDIYKSGYNMKGNSSLLQSKVINKKSIYI